MTRLLIRSLPGSFLLIGALAAGAAEPVPVTAPTLPMTGGYPSASQSAPQSAPQFVLQSVPPRYAAAPRPAHWMFAQSYYSHELSPKEWSDPTLPASRSEYRLPVTGANPGFAVRSRYRTNVFTLRNGRGGFDITLQRQGNVEFIP